MNTKTPHTQPTEQDRPWNWVGYDARQAGIKGVTIHFASRHPDGGWVIWFQKIVGASRPLWVTFVESLLSIPFRVYLIVYEKDGTPFRLVTKRVKGGDINQAVTREELQEFMRRNGQPL